MNLLRIQNNIMFVCNRVLGTMNIKKVIRLA